MERVKDLCGTFKGIGMAHLPAFKVYVGKKAESLCNVSRVKDGSYFN